jgi:hypothetical protein
MKAPRSSGRGKKWRLARTLPAWVLLALSMHSHAQLRLVTDEEAVRPDAKIATTRAITRGPGLKLASNESVKAAGFPFKVIFEPRGGVRIDPASVKVEYLKEPVVDLTERLRSAIRADSIDIPAAALPAGEHAFRVSVNDVDGRRGAIYFSLKALP